MCTHGKLPLFHFIFLFYLFLHVLPSVLFDLPLCVMETTINCHILHVREISKSIWNRFGMFDLNFIFFVLHLLGIRFSRYWCCLDKHRLNFTYSPFKSCINIFGRIQPHDVIDAYWIYYLGRCQHDINVSALINIETVIYRFGVWLISTQLYCDSIIPAIRDCDSGNFFYKN